jgi:Icc-related predicted phosphoesterase
MVLSFADPPPLNIAFFAYLRAQEITTRAQDACLDADIVISLGEVDLDALAEVVPAGKPALAVLGPNDSRQVPPTFKVLHGSGFQFKEWRVAGFSGAPRRGRSEGLYYSENESRSLLEALPACDLFLTHAPPAGLAKSGGTGERGFESVSAYVASKPPIYHFYAHPELNTTEDNEETLFAGVNGLLFPPPLEFC